MIKSSVLLVDDQTWVLKSLERNLRDCYKVRGIESGKELIKILEKEIWDVLVLDYCLHDTDASVLIPDILGRTSAPEIIVISGKANTKEAVECMKLGAFDFILKPYEIEEVITAINNALNKRKLKSERDSLLHHTLENYRLIGNSRVMQDLKAQIKTIAESNAHVLIQGETGTGKELVAHQIHFRSNRAGGPLQIINCAAIPKDLADSEFFGHVKGAFTGALRDRDGKISLAHNGTLFLDEIGDMSLEVQAKLLRFIETGGFERIGENKTRHSDVRIISATHHKLGDAVKIGGFRKDLFYRLNTCTISAPPLRDHKEDIPELVETFSKVAAAKHNKPHQRFTQDSIAMLIEHNWYGNVRELIHFIEKAVIFIRKDDIAAADLLLLQHEGSCQDSRKEEKLAEITAKAEREAIINRLIKYGGSSQKAAASLGIHLSSLYRKITKLGIQN